jgi:hypothetical protein
MTGGQRQIRRVRRRGKRKMSASTWRLGVMVAGAVLALVPGIGKAEEGSVDESRDFLGRIGEYALVGGGVTDFTKDAVKNRFGVGGGWDARLGLGTRSFVGAEVGYVGSFRTGAGADPDLATNGAEAVLRLQVPYVTGGWLVEPFAFGGIGWTRASLQDAPAGLKTSDDVGVVPFGGGITVGYRRLLLDARFTYRSTFDEDLALAAGQAPMNLSQWGVSASVGYEF